MKSILRSWKFPIETNLALRNSSPFIIRFFGANLGLFIRLLASIILVAFYSMIDWLSIQQFLRLCISMIFEGIGHKVGGVDVGSNIFLIVDDRWFQITSNCTYMYLFMMLVPFIWYSKKQLLNNSLRLFELLIIIWLINIARVIFSVHLDLLGIAWNFAHIIPHLVVNLTIIIFVFASWLKIEYRVNN